MQVLLDESAQQSTKRSFMHKASDGKKLYVYVTWVVHDDPYEIYEIDLLVNNQLYTLVLTVMHQS